MTRDKYDFLVLLDSIQGIWYNTNLIRKGNIMKSFETLNPMQQQAVLHTEGPLLVLAGAGSGKTRALTHRVAYLIEEKNVSPWNILAITFTNKAAGEMRERVNGLIPQGADSVWVSTFHSLCVRILRRFIENLGYESSFSIYDTDDQKTLMKQIFKEREINGKLYKERGVLGIISSAKNELVTPEEFALESKKDGSARSQQIAELYKEYQVRLKKNNALDFDDLLVKTVELFESCPEVLDYYQERFRYIMVDEYQDTNTAQFRLVSLLASKYRNICVVGDDDQSIYRFRGANIKNILSFEEAFPGAKVIKLEQNYRSTKTILSAANEVIRNNEGRKDKTLWTENEMGEKIRVKLFDTAYDEAEGIVSDIMKRGGSWKDSAVLYRTNAQSNAMEYSFKRNGIPYRIIGGTRFFDRAEVKDILAYLSVIANPTDETRLLRIVNEPPRGIGATSLEKIREIAAAENISVFEAMTTASHRTGIAAGKRMEEFCRMIAELQEAVSALPLDEFYDAVVERTGYALALETKGGDENVARLENIAELKSSIVKSVEANPDLDLYSYLDEVALYTDLDNYDRAEDAAVMMTMHAAKGLEFPVVFIIGAEEGLFPSMQAIGQSEDMEEERRLSYVAITRAREKLYITCAAQRMLYGRTSANLPSRFTEEIPQTLLDRQGLAKKKANLWDDDGTFISGRSGTWGGGASGYSGGGVSYRSGSFGTSYAARTGRTGAAKRAAPEKPKTVLSAPKAPDFKKGDRVVHKAFGKGVIEKMTPMGGDALVEVKFDSGETKRMMLRVAAQHMTKGE